jgi:hypothetical protein
MANCEERGRSRDILKHYPGVCLDKLTTATKRVKIAGLSTWNRSRSLLKANHPLVALSVLKQNQHKAEETDVDEHILSRY